MAVLLIPLPGLLALTVWAGRATAIDRILGTDAVQELRLRILPTVWRMIGDFMPWGSGLGSFETTYRLYEPDQMLMPAIMNHAHNDWLEIVLTGGVPAVLVGLLAVGVWVARAVALLRCRPYTASRLMPTLGLVIILLLAVAPLADYPLRVPSLECLLVCAAVWAQAQGRSGPPARTGADRVNEL